ncbi:MAG: exopolysaccharide biosynthesis polyprenyl glycosylphosphotransferase [Candidatus Omnitrophica bacterium]|nr:exopolysaccharide biosynthesis polyprenyl glycosylphosphotransferase [Candidatus Omnitrophota bacterium]
MWERKYKTFKYWVIFSYVMLSMLLLTSISHAQSNSDQLTLVSGVGTIAVFFMGVLGWIVNAARSSFLGLKRGFDIVLALIGMVLAAPIVAAVAILIKIVSPGPIFFKQERVGYKGKLFQIYKIRTMKIDAEKYTGPIWAMENDPRLIKCGKIIRKMHIDELPQLFNVLKGEMSIVGPRPERPVFVEKLSGEIADYKKRINVKPGITGLAQVRLKYDETIKDVRKKVKYDLLYIREMCLMVDLRILLRTVFVVLTGKGAR